MNKNTDKIHWVNNKAFYSKGGKFYPVMNEGGGTNPDFTTFENYSEQLDTVNGKPKKEKKEEEEKKMKWYHDPKSIATMGNSVAAGISGLAKNPQQEVTGKYTANQMNKYDGTGIQRGLGTALDTAAMLDPTGTTNIVNAGIKLAAAAGNVVNPGNKYGYSDSKTAEVTGNILNPFKRMQQMYTTGKKHGLGAAVEDFATFGISGNALQRADIKKGLDADRREDMNLRAGMNQGNYKSNSVYAKDGAYIKSKKANNKDKPNVEIENGEIYLGNIENVKRFGKSNTSIESSYGAKFHGDKHGKDTDKDGMEGIPLHSNGAYIASNHLGINGKIANKKDGGKTVADEMTPSIKALHQSETSSSDKYKSNPVSVAYHLQTINAIKNEAERNKFVQNLKQTVNNKNTSFNQIVDFMKSNTPQQDMTTNQQQVMNQSMNKLQAAEQQSMQDLYNTELKNKGYMPTGNKQSEPQMKEGGYNNKTTNNTMSNMNYNNNRISNLLNKYKQEGGEVNPSNQMAQQMSQQAPSVGGQEQMSQGMPQEQVEQPEKGGAAVEGLSPQSMEIFNQLPPEAQQQIMQMPVEQREQAIQQVAQQMGQMQQQGAEQAGGQEQSPQPQAPQAPQMDEVQEQSMRMGGQHRPVKLGEYVRYKCGGYMRSGKIEGYNPLTGKVKIKRD